MKKPTDIRVKRYAHQAEDETFAYAASVEPEDRSWVLFVPKDPKRVIPQLLVRCGTYTQEDGTEGECFAPIGSPEHLAFGDDVA